MTNPEAAQGKACHTFICSRGTLDGAYPPLILSINSRRLGNDAFVFFTFLGINVVRKGKATGLQFHPPGFLGAIPGMSWLATSMMARKIAAAGIPDIPELLETAQIEGVRLIGCKMTMDMMGLAASDLLEDVEVMNAGQYVKLAGGCSINMFT